MKWPTKLIYSLQMALSIHVNFKTNVKYAKKPSLHQSGSRNTMKLLQNQSLTAHNIQVITWILNLFTFLKILLQFSQVWLAWNSFVHLEACSFKVDLIRWVIFHMKTLFQLCFYDNYIFKHNMRLKYWEKITE